MRPWVDSESMSITPRRFPGPVCSRCCSIMIFASMSRAARRMSESKPPFEARSNHVGTISQDIYPDPGVDRCDQSRRLPLYRHADPHRALLLRHHANFFHLWRKVGGQDAGQDYSAETQERQFFGFNGIRISIDRRPPRNMRKKLAG